MIRLLLLSLAALLVFADPAAADPISGLIAAGKALLATKIGAIVAQVALQAGLSLLAQRLRKKPKQTGLQNQFKGRGGTEPGSLVLGRAAVKGHQTYHNSQGDNSKYYHEVIELCDLPGATLERVIIDGEYSALGDDYLDGNVGAIGKIIVAKNKDSDSHRAFIKYYDGTQTAADPMLVEGFATADRRWTTNHKLQGIAYAVLTYYFDRKRFPRGVPELSFEMLGIPVYDVRKDGSVGGSGSHRWTDPTTWEQSENLIVLVYNILRGIAAPGGGIWGGDCEHEDLPMANWVAAMNACDVDVDGRKKYTGGIEARWTDEPRDIIEQLLAGCNGQITELGGVYRVQVDAPETALVSLTDDDFSVSDPSELMPFPGLDGTFNGGSVSHPDPAQLWNASAAHTITNATWEAQDGTRRLFDLQLPVVYNTAQAKQVLNAAINDGRRFRRHKGTLPPDLFFLDTLNTFAWTSAAEGYTNKLFEIAEAAYDLLTLNLTVSVRERDPGDFPIVPGLELGSTTGVTTPIIRLDAGVTGFTFNPVIIQVEDGPKRPAFKLGWDADALEGNIAGIAYELRIVGSDVLAKSGSTTDVAAGSLILSGDIIPDGLYEARPKALSDVRDTIWDNWLQARAPNVGIGADEFWAQIQAQADEAFDRFSGNFQAAIDRTEIGTIDALLSDFLNKAETDGEITRVENTVTQSIANVSANLTQNYVLATTLTGALATLEESLNTSIDDVSADVTTLTSALATTNQAAAQFQQTVTANFGTVNSNFTSLTQSLASTDQAVTALQNTLASEIDGVEAWAQQTFRTEAQVDTAVADAVSEVETEVNGLSTTVSLVQSSVNGVRGLVGFKINNNGAIAQMGIQSDIIDGEPLSDILMESNNFYFRSPGDAGGRVAPFAIVGGKTYIKTAAIQDLSVDSLKIADRAISVPFRTYGARLEGNGNWQTAATINAGLRSGARCFFVINWAFEQGYAQAVDWAFRIKESGIVIRERDWMGAVNDYPSGSIQSSEFTVLPTSTGAPRPFIYSLEWRGENSNISCWPFFELRVFYK